MTQRGRPQLHQSQSVVQTDPITKLGRAAAECKQRKVDLEFWFECLVVVRWIVGTIRFGQADLSKTEPRTEAPMTQLGRAAASSAFDRAWQEQEPQ